MLRGASNRLKVLKDRYFILKAELIRVIDNEDGKFFAILYQVTQKTI